MKVHKIKNGIFNQKTIVFLSLLTFFFFLFMFEGIYDFI